MDSFFPVFSFLLIIIVVPLIFCMRKILIIVLTYMLVPFKESLCQQGPILKDGLYYSNQSHGKTFSQLIIKKVNKGNFFFVVSIIENEKIMNNRSKIFGIIDNKKNIGIIDENSIKAHIKAIKLKKENSIDILNTEILFLSNKNTIDISLWRGHRCEICQRFVFRTSDFAYDFSIDSSFEKILFPITAKAKRKSYFFDFPEEEESNNTNLKLGDLVYIEDVYRNYFFIIKYDSKKRIEKFGCVNSNDLQVE